MQDLFKKYPNDLFEARKLNCVDKCIDLDHNIKAVYLYMLLRYEFFKTTDGVFYENQDEIGKKCGLSRRSIIRYIQKLTDVGLVQVGKKRLANGALSNNYIIHRVDGEKWWYDDNRGKKTYIPSQKPVVAKPQPPVEIDDYPF